MYFFIKEEKPFPVNKIIKDYKGSVLYFLCDSKWYKFNITKGASEILTFYECLVNEDPTECEEPTGENFVLSFDDEKSFLPLKEIYEQIEFLSKQLKENSVTGERYKNMFYSRVSRIHNILAPWILETPQELIKHCWKIRVNVIQQMEQKIQEAFNEKLQKRPENPNNSNILLPGRDF